MRGTFTKQRRSRDFDILMKCLRIAFENYPKKEVKKTEAKFRFSETFQILFLEDVARHKKNILQFSNFFHVLFERNQQRKNETLSERNVKLFNDSQIFDLSIFLNVKNVISNSEIV